jgi:hypothetical protein
MVETPPTTQAFDNSVKEFLVEVQLEEVESISNIQNGVLTKDVMQMEDMDGVKEQPTSVDFMVDLEELNSSKNCLGNSLKILSSLSWSKPIVCALGWN